MASITPAAADKFYFYKVRIEAAKNVSDPQNKIQLLSHCITDFPQRDLARVPLFEAATFVLSDEYAIGVIEPILRTEISRYDFPTANDDEIVGSGEGEDHSDREPTPSFSPDVNVTREQHAKVAALIADTFMRLNRPNDAVPYYKSARQAEDSSLTQKSLARKLADAQAQLRIQQQNSARQPILHEALEQDRVVRPRVLAQAVSTPKSAREKRATRQLQ